MIQIIKKQISFTVVILLCHLAINSNMQAAENNFENIAIVSSHPFIKLFQHDIELIEPFRFVMGEPFEIKPLNPHHNTYSIQTNFAPWDNSYYFVMAIENGSWKQVSKSYSGKKFKDKSLWIVGQYENIQ